MKTTQEIAQEAVAKFYSEMKAIGVIDASTFDRLGERIIAKAIEEAQAQLELERNTVHALSEQLEQARKELAAARLNASYKTIAMGHGVIEVGDAVWDGLPALWVGNDGQGMGVERERNNAPKPGETLVVFTFTNIGGLEAIESAVSRVRQKIQGLSGLLG